MNNLQQNQSFIFFSIFACSMGEDPQVTATPERSRTIHLVVPISVVYCVGSIIIAFQHLRWWPCPVRILASACRRRKWCTCYMSGSRKFISNTFISFSNLITTSHNVDIVSYAKIVVGKSWSMSKYLEIFSYSCIDINIHKLNIL